MGRTAIIYALREEGSDQIRYVGSTRMPIENRISGHLCKSEKSMTNRPFKEWVWSVAGRLVVDVLEKVPEEIQFSRERVWTSKIYDLGHPIFNKYGKKPLPKFRVNDLTGREICEAKDTTPSLTILDKLERAMLAIEEERK